MQTFLLLLELHLHNPNPKIIGLYTKYVTPLVPRESRMVVPYVDIIYLSAI